MLFHVDKANFSSRIQSFDVVRCKECGLAFMSPFPSASDVAEIYVKESVFSSLPSSSVKRHWSASFLEPLYFRSGNSMSYLVRQALKKTDATESLRVLDVGCSSGALLEMFGKRVPSAQLFGVDVDPGGREKAPDWLKENISVGLFPEMDFPGDFDVITFHHVIEHLLDPMEYLQKAVSCLAPGGVLVISTPDIESKGARQAAGDWSMVNSPHLKLGHVAWYDRKVLEFLAEDLGLDLVFCRNRGTLFPELSERNRALLLKIFGREPVRGRFIRSYPIRILWSILFDGIFAEWFNYGESLYALFKKRVQEK